MNSLMDLVGLVGRLANEGEELNWGWEPGGLFSISLVFPHWPILCGTLISLTKSK